MLRGKGTGARSSHGLVSVTANQMCVCGETEKDLGTCIKGWKDRQNCLLEADYNQGSDGLWHLRNRFDSPAADPWLCFQIGQLATCANTCTRFPAGPQIASPSAGTGFSSV